MRRLWTFRCYVSSSGKDQIAKWYGSLSPEAQAAFDTLKQYLEQRVRDDWRRPAFDQLSDGIGEMRFKADKVEHRPLGFFGPGRAEFTILVGARKKGRVYTPADALVTAGKRRKEVLRDARRSKICDS